MTLFLKTGLSLDDTSRSGTLLILVRDEDVDELPEDELELADDEEFTIGGGFDDFPFILDFAEDPLASFSCDNDVINGTGVFRFSFGDV